MNGRQSFFIDDDDDDVNDDEGFVYIFYDTH